MAHLKGNTITEWKNIDYKINKNLWSNRGYDNAIPIRNKNLIELAQEFEINSIPYWLQGKTLLGLYKYGHLIAEDNDDDVGVHEQYRLRVKNIVYTKLTAMGFQVIRDSHYFISILRNDRYIDICFFREKDGLFGYGNKWFPKNHFADFSEINYLGKSFPIPRETERLLNFMYNQSIYSKFFNGLKRYVKLATYVSYYKRKMTTMANKTPHVIRLLLKPLFKTAGISYKKLTETEFYEMLIEPENSVNWYLRQPHLSIFTRNGEYKKIGSIISYLSNNSNLQELLAVVKETDTSKAFYEPNNLDKRFWQSGNNYFIYCINYQFRKGVIPYSKANAYIKNTKKPTLYSAYYYESLETMSDDEIKKFLMEKPIEITQGACTSGKHRVCAMIGRLIDGKGYIPIWAIVK